MVYRLYISVYWLVLIGYQYLVEALIWIMDIGRYWKYYDIFWKQMKKDSLTWFFLALYKEGEIVLVII